jgi:hypothetical protein
MERKVRTTPAQLHGLENKKKSGRRRDIFLDIPLYRTYQDFKKKTRIGIRRGRQACWSDASTCKQDFLRGKSSLEQVASAIDHERGHSARLRQGQYVAVYFEAGRFIQSLHLRAARASRI